MRAVTFNPYTGNSEHEQRSNVMEMIEAAHFPEVVALEESHIEKPLPGYDHFWWQGLRQDTTHTSLMIRQEGTEVRREFFIEPGGPDWFGPVHNLRHPPRKFPAVTFIEEGVHDRQRWTTAAIHRIPNDFRNPEAIEFEWNAITHWANARPKRRPIVMPGDWNGRESEPDFQEFERKTGMEFQLLGPDGFATRNCRITYMRKLERKFGSDAHRPVVAEFQVVKA